MGINPDEAVAYGATIQAGIISREAGLDNIILVDVCLNTLGIETIGGMFSLIIQANAPLPACKSEIYSTSTDNQRTVTLKVFQGEDGLNKNNILLGTFELSSIPLAAQGMPQIEVVFEVDNNSMMVVSANSKENGNSASIILWTCGNQLSEMDISHMLEEIDQMASQDKTLHNCHAKLNELHSLIIQEQSKLTKGDSLYMELEKHMKWVESVGQRANIAELQEHFSNIQDAIRVAGSGEQLPDHHH
ncbi:ATPase with role in protein import into the ER [Ceratobasidium sp. 423]|nr:ATPase with role in protein import into the ER [Ceratobasidium sp. 423]